MKLPGGGFRTFIAGTQAASCPWRQVNLAKAWQNGRVDLNVVHRPVKARDAFAFAVDDGGSDLGFIPAPIAMWLWKEMRRGRKVKCALLWVGGEPNLGARIYLYLASGEPLRVPVEAIAQCQSPKTRMDWAKGGHAAWARTNKRP